MLKEIVTIVAGCVILSGGLVLLVFRIKKKSDVDTEPLIFIIGLGLISIFSRVIPDILYAILYTILALVAIYWLLRKKPWREFQWKKKT